MTKKIYVTRKIPEAGLKMLRDKGYEMDINPKDRPLKEKELVLALKKKNYDAVLCLLTDQIGAKIFDSVPTAKIFANYAVGFNNINVEEAKKRGVMITNTPGALTDTVAEHTMALILSLTCRIVEGDSFTRKGKFKGWAPMHLLGMDLKGKTLGILGAGRIGSRVAHHAKNGFGMNIIYFDVKRNEEFEKEHNAKYFGTVDGVLKEADVVSVHVPLLDSTRHLMNKERLAMMKKTAYLVNTSRGPVIDENALVEALKNRIIRGAALDVFENEPKLAKGLSKLDNVVITPHIASATEKARDEMAILATTNIIAFFEGKTPPNLVG